MDDLETIADVLGYSVRREYEVSRTGAAVDLAWFAAGDNRSPLMIFEVESNASASMANNAMKVFSQDVDNFVKPLFFFHILLSGGPDNERIASLRRTWGTHNYRVYRLNEAQGPEELVRDILEQHRRLTEKLTIERLFNHGLTRPSWSSIDRMRTYKHVEILQFSSNHRRALARLGFTETIFRPVLLDGLRNEYVANVPLSGSYGTAIGEYFSGIIEIPLLAAEGTISDAEAPKLLDNWQAQAGFGIKRIGPHFGLDREYDEFVLRVAPFLFASAAAICQGRLQTKTWIVRELNDILTHEHEVNVAPAYLIPAQLWLLHMTASALRDGSNIQANYDEFDLLDIYSRTRAAIWTTRISFETLTCPPNAQDLLDPDYEFDRLMIDPMGEQSYPPRDYPEWYDLNSGYFPQNDHHSWNEDRTDQLPWQDSFQLAIGVLTDDAWGSWPSIGIVRALHSAEPATVGDLGAGVQ